jgi:hypothetical protein
MPKPKSRPLHHHAERISKLSDQEVLAIVDSIAGEWSEIDTPSGEKDQAQALSAALSAVGETLEFDRLGEADAVAAGHAAREVLRMMALVPELVPSVDEWLENPPRQEAAAVPLILAAPAVFSGCIALLYVVGHASFKRSASGKWTVNYDPTTKTPMDNTLKDMVKTLAGLMRSLLASDDPE